MKLNIRLSESTISKEEAKKKKEKGGGGVGCEGLERNGSRMKDVEAELLCTSCSELT